MIEGRIVLMKRLLTLILATWSVAALTGDAWGGVLFRDEMVDPNGWGKNANSTDNTATFNYNYSADGIPEAPNSQGGDAATRGVKLEANNTNFVDSADFFTLYPLGQSFSGNYQLRFDAWQNYSTFDREQDGGAGTTEFLGGGIGYDGTTADVASGVQAIETGDGGSGSDYRVFSSDSSVPSQYFLASGEMWCGSRNATGCTTYTDQYPAGSGVPPAAQGQTGSPNQNRAGSSAFQWYTWQFSVRNDIVSVQQFNKLGERLVVATWDNSDPNDAIPTATTDGNISIFYADFFSSVSPSAALMFGIVDNVIVTVPEPATLAVFGLGCCGLAFVRRKRS